MALHPFRFGVVNESMLPPVQWIDHVRKIEALGFDTFLLRDHLVADFFGHQYAPLIALMAAASATERLRVGTMVIDNDFRHPAMLAKEAATLDLFSRGRFELGIGAGWLRAEYEQTGMQYDSPGTRIERLSEAIGVIKGAWRSEPFTFAGKHYQITGLDTFPKPLQQPHPPILVGGGHRKILRLAGREANSVGILTTSVATGVVVADPQEQLPAAVDQKLAWVREGAGERFTSIELSMFPNILVSETRRATTEAWLAERGWSGMSVEDAWQMPVLLVGSVEQIVADLLERRERYGFSYLIIADKYLDAFAPVVARLRNT